MIRRLGPGDEGVLAVLAADDADFDLEERSGPREPVAGADAAAYLRDPSVLHWVAEEDGVVVGHLLAYLERRRAGRPRQVLLYEIGAPAPRCRPCAGRGDAALDDRRGRRRGVGPGRQRRGGGVLRRVRFVRDDVQPVQMTLQLPTT